MQSTQRKRNFRSVRLEATVGHFPQNSSYPFRSKVDFQVERFKLLAIHSVLSKKASLGTYRCYVGVPVPLISFQ
uniref:Uncharacterized protein n=1 Tax=Romanomermis culicivorax TaxID=13658 RepID=A0A915JV39_ROMCU